MIPKNVEMTGVEYATTGSKPFGAAQRVGSNPAGARQALERLHLPSELRFESRRIVDRVTAIRIHGGICGIARGVECAARERIGDGISSGYGGMRRTIN